MAAFKSKGKKCFRKRRHSSEDELDSDEEEQFSVNLDDIKELQKLRDKPNGVNVLSLALGKKVVKTEEATEGDPFNMKSGGMVDMNALKQGKIKDDEGKTIGTCFAAETNRRDEDTEMLKYVEVELSRRKGHETETEDNRRTKSKEDALYALPEHLKIQSSIKKSEDMLSNQMLSGIPEVDLGIEAKIKNIETTEEAKQKMIDERRKKKEEVSEFVPTNYAVNFVQHNRFTIEDTSPKNVKKPEAPKPQPLRVGDFERRQTPGGEGAGTNNARDKATDDFHFEKFRKQLRRY